MAEVIVRDFAAEAADAESHIVHLPPSLREDRRVRLSPSQLTDLERLRTEARFMIKTRGSLPEFIYRRLDEQARKIKERQPYTTEEAFRSLMELEMYIPPPQNLSNCPWIESEDRKRILDAWKNKRLGHRWRPAYMEFYRNGHGHNGSNGHGFNGNNNNGNGHNTYKVNSQNGRSHLLGGGVMENGKSYSDGVLQRYAAGNPRLPKDSTNHLIRELSHGVRMFAATLGEDGAETLRYLLGESEQISPKAKGRALECAEGFPSKNVADYVKAKLH